MSGRFTSRPTALLAVGASCALLVGLLASPAAASETALAASRQATHGLGALPTDDYVSPAAGLGAYRRLIATETGRASSAPLPAAVDLSAFAPPVGDQGRVNSCVMWAIDYGMLGWYANRQSHLGAPYAPMYAYSQIQDKYHWQDEGAYSRDAYDIAQEQGIAPQASYPRGNYDWWTLPTDPERTIAAAHKTSGFQYLYGTSSAPGDIARTAIQTALANGQPAALMIPVYDEFYDLDSADSTLDVSEITGGSYGYHEVLIVGYDQAGVQIQNSWGTWWGNHGFATLSWGFVTGYTHESSVMTGFLTGATTAPVVTGLSTTGGPTAGGNDLTVTGLGFTGTTAVRFGTTTASFTVLDTQHLRVTAPAAGPATVDVTVTSGTGTSPAGAGSRYTYAPLPVVTGLSAPTGSVTGGTTVTVNGSGLGSATQVRFGATSAPFHAATDASLVAVSPPGAAGPVAVTVTTPGGLSASTASTTFSYQPVPAPTPPVAALPSLWGLSRSRAPTSGGGTVTLTGAALSGLTGVLFGDARASITAGGDTSVTVTVPAHPAGTVEVTVTTAAGRSVALPLSQFTFVSPPTVSGLSATRGPARGGTRVTVRGTVLADVTAVYFSAHPGVGLRHLPDGSVSVVTPPGSGTVTVRATGDFGSSAALGSARYTYLAAPTITAVSAKRGPTKGGRTVTLTGRGFLAGTAVYFGQTKARSVHVTSSGRLTAVTPRHKAGTVTVTVVSVGGKTSRAHAYRYQN